MRKYLTFDKFRLFASILIIAIHTYPLFTINENLDFVFTHVFCRIAVPFFLMITGYFVMEKATQNKDFLINYTIKTLKLYLFCILLYLPINIYAKTFETSNIISILKDIFINGTFYHLWYFPALILGLWILYFLLKKLKGKKVIVILSILYIIGIFGDSLGNLSLNIAYIKDIYKVIFSIFDYTRNGIFYVPIFLYLGYLFRKIKFNISRSKNVILIIIFILLMIVEGIIYNKFDLQIHDSMYFMLPIVMVLIFNLILQNSNENNKSLRNISTIIYITHPLFIIFVRGVGKILNLENIIVDNNLIHYILVVLTTVIFSICFEKLSCIVRLKYEQKFNKK